jgi:ABC-type nitrate/sulfonate/bicarbonate transport system ATPase subunit
MNAATTPAAGRPGAHLRLVSDPAGSSTTGIRLSGVSKTYRARDGDVPSLRPLDFHINEGEFFVVVGPSGCGKSTLLKMISGLLAPSTGEILVEGEPVTKPHGNVGIVFQNSLLLPWRNTDYVKANADLVKRFMSATTKAVEAAEKEPKAAAQSIPAMSALCSRIRCCCRGATSSPT